MNIKVHGVKYHRNGVSGQGFHVVGFTWLDTDRHPSVNREMVGWVYSPSTVDPRGESFPPDGEPDPRDWPKLRLDMAYGVIDLAEPWRTWRGDHFFPDLCAAIEQADIDGTAHAERGSGWYDLLTPGVPRLPRPEPLIERRTGISLLSRGWTHGSMPQEPVGL